MNLGLWFKKNKDVSKLDFGREIGMHGDDHTIKMKVYRLIKGESPLEYLEFTAIEKATDYQVMKEDLEADRTKYLRKRNPKKVLVPPKAAE